MTQFSPAGQAITLRDLGKKFMVAVDVKDGNHVLTLENNECIVVVWAAYSVSIFDTSCSSTISCEENHCPRA